MRTLPGLSFGAALALLVYGCGGPSSPAEPQAIQGSPKAACAPLPALSPLSKIAPKASTFGILLTGPITPLKKQLEQRVPRVMAQARGRAIGAPGKVDYVIKRGAFNLNIEAEQVAITTQLSGDIKVCKPIGPFCPQYGHCTPTWNVQVALPIELSWAERPSPVTSVNLGRGCVLSPVGVNVTSELKKITRKQARGARNRIRNEVGGFHQRLQTELASGLAPIPLSTGQCLHYEPASVLFDLRQNGADITLAAEASGSIQHNDCDTDNTSTSLPDPVRKPGLEPHGSLHLQAHLSLKELGESLTRELKNPTHLQTGLRLGASHSEQKRLFIIVTTAECETLWFETTPRIEDNKLRFSLVSSQKETPLRGERARLAKLLENKVALGLPTALRSDRQALEAALHQAKAPLDSLREQLPAEIDFGVQLPSRIERRISLGPESLVFTTTLFGVAEASWH